MNTNWSGPAHKQRKVIILVDDQLYLEMLIWSSSDDAAIYHGAKIARSLIAGQLSGHYTLERYSIVKQRVAGQPPEPESV